MAVANGAGSGGSANGGSALPSIPPLHAGLAQQHPPPHERVPVPAGAAVDAVRGRGGLGTAPAEARGRRLHDLRRAAPDGAPIPTPLPLPSALPPLPAVACRSPAPPRPAQSKPKGLLESSKIPRHFESDSPSKLGAELTKLNTKLMQTFLAVLDEMLTNPTVGGLDAAGQPLGDWVPVAAGQSLEKLKVGAPPP